MSRKQRDRGAAAVEFALILPLLLLLVVGIAEFGRAYHLQTTLSGAAREGVRVMALHNSVTSTRETVRGYAPDLHLTDDQIRVTPSSCLTTASTPTATATVTVTYPMRFVTGLFGADLTLTGKGTMRCHG
ncbi:TadE family protein [Georgenia thermotolerans]|uniref:Pilus assembly protein n=1 Tax=Georgenia thermotolerans TaxID=527326 RepID=A0A7J5UMW2_9MICO|nr:TadE family protein [Georgenia thermotolerans]KAE8763444.1 pilus assembly protein [Georgenia thermotolerans]